MMGSKAVYVRNIFVILALSVATCLAGCQRFPEDSGQLADDPDIKALSPTETEPAEKALEILDFGFPSVIKVNEHYIFYLHGKIIEDQGLEAVSPEFGEYQYLQILESLQGHGFFVISEARPKDADVWLYAEKVSEQVKVLLDAGVPPANITVVGASKGGYIAILVSHLLENEKIKFVFMAICNPDVIADLTQNQINVYGSVLSVFDTSDDYAGSCQELFSYSEGEGISRYQEVVLEVGTGHGILYQPLPEWVNPVVRWAGE